MQHLKNPYHDVLMMPTCERRFFLGLATKTAIEREEQMEEMKKNVQNRNSKGGRTTSVSGDALKAKIKSGQVPLS
jgi:hypothetical protein